MSADLDPLFTLTAEANIRRVLAKYASAVDRLNLDELRSCYTSDAVDDHGTYKGHIDGLVDHLGELLSRHRATTHFLGNCQIEVRNRRAAISETYSLVYCRYQSSRSATMYDMIGAIRYLDQWSLDESRALIRRRIVAYDWTRIDPVSRTWPDEPDTTGRVRPAGSAWASELTT